MKYLLSTTLLLFALAHLAYAQNVGIGTSTPKTKLHVVGNTEGAAVTIENMLNTGPLPQGLSVRVVDALGTAIQARAENTGGTTAPMEIVGSAIRASAADGRNAVSAYTTTGVALRARSAIQGKALFTEGPVRMLGIGEALGRVLTSDFAGNASWQAIPPQSELENNGHRLELAGNGTTTQYGTHFFVRPNGTPPVFNPSISDGYYFLWNGNKGAIRAGSYIFNQLRNDSLGLFSVGLGQHTMAKERNTAAIGVGVRAEAAGAQAFGSNTTAQSFRETVLGSYNETTTPISTTAWNTNDRLFTVGNGSSSQNASNALVMLKNGATGIGINNPIAPLHVKNKLVIERPANDATTLAALEYRSNGAYRGALCYSPADDHFLFYEGASNAQVFYIKNGRLGVRRIPATNNLEVDGSASKSSPGDWLGNSDARLKKNISQIDTPLEKLLQLKGISFEWADDKTGQQRPAGLQYGFTAQNVQAIFPQLVSADAQGYLQTAYGTYDPLIVEAIRQLKLENEVLRQELDDIKKLLKNIKTVSATNMFNE